MIEHIHGVLSARLGGNGLGYGEGGERVSGHVEPLLDALRADPGRAEYYRGLLEPLRRYDAEHHGDLVITLASYLRHGGNATRTADALYLHRNSMRYRLARIQALTGLDPDDPDARLALHVGILIISQNQPDVDFGK